jgi:hypothetical protein
VHEIINHFTYVIYYYNHETNIINYIIIIVVYRYMITSVPVSDAPTSQMGCSNYPGLRGRCTTCRGKKDNSPSLGRVAIINPAVVLSRQGSMALQKFRLGISHNCYLKILRDY